MQRTRDAPFFLFRRRAVLLWARIVLLSVLSLSWIGNAAAAVNSVDTRQRQQLPQLSQDWSDIHDIGLAIRARRQDNETPLGMQVHLFAFSVSLGVWIASRCLFHSCYAFYKTPQLIFATGRYCWTSGPTSRRKLCQSVVYVPTE